MVTLAAAVAKLDQDLSRMEKERYSSPLANDIYEAACYWRDLGRWILEGNTKVKYPARAAEERSVLEKLAVMARTQSPNQERRYQSCFEAASVILRAAAETEPPKDGHMGILRIIRAHFDFLETDYALAIVDEQPLGMKYASAWVWIELKYGERSSQLCTFGPQVNSGSVFW